MSEPEYTVLKQRPAHLFKPGQSGNPAGRPRGARSKLAEDFIRDLAESWAVHGPRALVACATESPDKYCKIIADLMPRNIDLNLSVDATAFAEKFRTAQAMLGNPEPERQRRALPNQTVIDHDD